jgi:hypothetical protein
MNRAALEELKDEIRQRARPVVEPHNLIAMHDSRWFWPFMRKSLIYGHGRIQPPSRIAIGGRWRGRDDFSLVLRLHGHAPAEASLARELVERVGPEEVDVAVVEDLRVEATAASFGVARVRPLELGYSIGHERGSYGTLGAFVGHDQGDAVLSSNHILALMNAAQIGDPIVQPGPKEPARSERIGALCGMEPLHFQPHSNRVDAALALIDQAVGHGGNILPRRSGARDGGRRLADVVEDPYELEAMTGSLAKIGRTTGYTAVPLSQVSLGMDNVEIHFGATPVRFDDLIEVEWDGPPRFTDEGDSGSIYYIEHERHALGVHIGGGTLIRDGRRTAVSYGCVLSAVLERLQARLLM